MHEGGGDLVICICKRVSQAEESLNSGMNTDKFVEVVESIQVTDCSSIRKIHTMNGRWSMVAIEKGVLREV